MSTFFLIFRKLKMWRQILDDATYKKSSESSSSWGQRVECWMRGGWGELVSKGGIIPVQEKQQELWRWTVGGDCTIVNVLNATELFH